MSVSHKLYFVAYSTVLRRLSFVIGGVPFAIAVLPFVLCVLFVIMRIFTNYVIWTFLGTLVGTAWFVKQIHRLAETPQVRDATLYRNRIRLPLRVFLLNCVLFHYVGPILEKLQLGWTGLSFDLSWIVTALRLSFALIFQGILVTSRYVGPTSVMRCSSVPLASNLWWASFQYFLQNPGLILQSGESGEIRFFGSPVSKLGRRLRRPTKLAYLQHTVLSILAGFAVAASIPLSEDQVSWYSISLCCVFTMLNSMFTVLPLLGGDVHELDPSRYTKLRWRELIFVWNVAPALFIPVSAGLLSGRHFGGLTWMFVTCGISTLYLLLLDQAIRIDLFHNAIYSLLYVIDQLDGDESGITLTDMLLHSLLNEASVVEKVWSPPLLRLHFFDELSDRVGEIMRTRIDPRKELPLEEDVLRITILQSLASDTSPFPKLPYLFSRSKGSVLDCIQIADDPHSSLESLYYPLLRGLSVFISGFGKTLSVITTSSSGPKKSTVTSLWSLPPASILCAEYAVEGISRCITLKLFPSNQNEIGCNIPLFLSHITIVLQAIYQLRNGASLFRQSRADESDSEERKWTMKRCADLEHTCDRVASSILHKIKDTNLNNSIDRDLKQETLLWKQSLLSNSSVQGFLRDGHRKIQ